MNPQRRTTTWPGWTGHSRPAPEAVLPPVSPVADPDGDGPVRRAVNKASAAVAREEHRHPVSAGRHRRLSGVLLPCEALAQVYDLDADAQGGWFRGDILPDLPTTSSNSGPSISAPPFRGGGGTGGGGGASGSFDGPVTNAQAVVTASVGDDGFLVRRTGEGRRRRVRGLR